MTGEQRGESGHITEREFLEGLRREDKFPGECTHEDESVLIACMDCEEARPLPDSIVMLDIISVADIRTLMAKLLGGPDGYPSDVEAEGAFRRLYDSLPPL